jgi:hypothetical protein
MIWKRNKKKAVRTKRRRTIKIIQRLTLRRKKGKDKDRINENLGIPGKCRLGDKV